MTQIIPPIDHNYIFQAGYNFNIDEISGPPQDVIAVGGDAYLPTGDVRIAALINIHSDSADDSEFGDGARFLRIFGLDTDYFQRTEDIALDGTGFVHPAHNYHRIQDAVVITGGVAGGNVGTITIDDGVGVFGIIVPGANRFLQAVFTIPAGVRGFLRFYKMNMFRIIDTPGMSPENIALADVVGALMFRPFGGVFERLEMFHVTPNSPHITTLEKFEIPPRSDVKLRILEAFGQDGNIMRVAASFEIFLR